MMGRSDPDCLRHSRCYVLIRLFFSGLFIHKIYIRMRKLCQGKDSFSFYGTFKVIISYNFHRKYQSYKFVHQKSTSSFLSSEWHCSGLIKGLKVNLVMNVAFVLYCPLSQFYLLLFTQFRKERMRMSNDF